MLFCLVLGTPLQYLPAIFRCFPDTGESQGFPLTGCCNINAPTRTAYPDTLSGQRSGQSGVRLSDRSISPQEVQLEGLFRTHLQHSAMGTRPMPAYARGCRLSVTVL